jgi:hypothetical protein
MRNGQSDPPDKARTPRFTTGSTVPRGVAKAIQFIRENLTARLDSDALAIASGLSGRGSRRQFRCFAGQSPAEFHRGLRRCQGFFMTFCHARLTNHRLRHVAMGINLPAYRVPGGWLLCPSRSTTH